MTRLVGITYSPWSRKARWALDHHGVSYQWQEYLPMVGAPALRARTGRWRGRLTVPILIDDTGVYTDSFDIARRAEAIGQGPPLFPDVEAVSHWNQLAEQLATAGRARTTRLVAADPEARRENVPPFVPAALRTAFLPLVDAGVKYLVRKYQLDAEPIEASEAHMAAVLEATRAALCGHRYLLGDFSYADITLGLAMQFVKPADDAFLRMGPGNRRCWTSERLAEEYADVVAWRDGMFAEHWPWRRRN